MWCAIEQPRDKCWHFLREQIDDAASENGLKDEADVLASALRFFETRHKALDERDCHGGNEGNTGELDGEVEHRADRLFREERKFRGHAKRKKRRRDQRHRQKFDFRYEEFERRHEETICQDDDADDGNEQNAETVKVNVLVKCEHHVKSELHDLVDDVAELDSRRRTSRLAAQQLEALAESAHERDPVHHEKHIEAHLEHDMNEVLQLVAADELGRQIPCRLDDRQDDEQAQAIA